MGDAYVDRLRDTSALLFQMQSYAACSDAVIQERVRDRFGVARRARSRGSRAPSPSRSGSSSPTACCST